MQDSNRESISDMPECPITSIRDMGRSLSIPADAPADETWVYGLGFPLQLAQEEGGIFVNIGRKDRIASHKQGDMETGSDLVIFSDVNDIPGGRVVPLTRGGEIVTNPRTDEELLLSSYPISGGLVPFGARREDGSAHPHAGQGFGWSNVLGYPAHSQGGPEALQERFSYWVLQQYLYDGETFRITESRNLAADEILPGESISSPPLSNAIPDENDLLSAVGVSLRHRGDPEGGSLCGVVRWRCRPGGNWQAESFMPAEGAARTYEPTLVRDLDGSLLLCARPGKGDRVCSILVWRSVDGGESWEEIIRLDDVRRGPVTINRATDGTPYIAANQLRTPSGRECGFHREALSIWPLAEDRRSLLPQILVRDLFTELGPRPDELPWVMDHPSGLTLRLADCRDHHLLVYRLLGGMPRPSAALACQPLTGTHVAEIFSPGPAIPEWTF